MAQYMDDKPMIMVIDEEREEREGWKEGKVSRVC